MASSEIPTVMGAPGRDIPAQSAMGRWTLARPPCVAAEILWAAFVAEVVIARNYPSDASLFPTIIGSLGILLASLFLLLSLVRRDYAAQNLADMEAAAGKPRQFWIAFAASPAYTLLIYLIGFDPSTFIAMIAMPYLLGYRGWLRLLAVAAALVVALHLVFVSVFQIELPAGLAGDYILRHFVYED